MWAEPHSYEQVYDYIDNRVCDECVRQNSQDQVSVGSPLGSHGGPQPTRWRKQGWNGDSEVRAMEGFLEEEENTSGREETVERRLRKMNMMELVEKEREKRKAHILIPEEMEGIFEDVNWDIEPRPEETKMDTGVAKLLDAEWIDVKESRLKVTQEQLVESGKRLHDTFEKVVSLSCHTKERVD